MDQEFLEFLNCHQSAIRKVCRMYTDSSEDHEDLFQETVYQLWRAYPTFRGESSGRTWVYRVALNIAISALRRKTKADKHVLLDAHLEQAPSTDLVGAETRRIEILYRVIRRLNQVDRALILLYLEDLSYKELASILGLSESNVGVRLNRIKAKLQTFAKELE